MAEIITGDGTPLLDREILEGTKPFEPTNPLADVEAQNKALVDEIRALGGQIPPVLLIHLQLDTLINLLLPEGGTLRQVFDFEVEHRMTAVLTELKAQVLRERLKV